MSASFSHSSPPGVGEGFDKRTHVLVVDDEADLRVFLRTLLTTVGYQVIEAESGKEAVALLDTGRVDAILLDVSLPDLDGYDVCRAIRRHPRHAQTPLILITAVYMTSQDEVRGLLAGADDYVRKPFVNDVLLARLKTLLRARQSELELQQRNHELLLLNKLATTTSDTLHLRPLLETALETVCELMGPRAARLTVSVDPDEPVEITHGSPPEARSDETVVAIPLRSHGPTLGTLEMMGLPAWYCAQDELLGSIGSTLAVAIDRARLHSEVQHELEIKNLLLREVQHRVRNSLQGIIGLLSLQMTTQRQSPEANTALAGALQRIKSMASLQKYLTDQAALTVSVHHLIKRVVHHTISQAVLEPGAADFVLNGPDAELSNEQAQALGMVVQELAHNAIRHGSSQNPNLRIRTEADGDNYRVVIQNRGHVLPADFSIEGYANTGLRICRDLIAREFRGRLELEPDPERDGTRATITLPRASLRTIQVQPAHAAGIEENQPALGAR